MKCFSAVVLAVLLSAGAFAQGRGGGGGRGGGAHGGGFHGGGHGMRPPVVNPPIGVTGVIPFRTFGSPTGFPNILFPGTGNQPPIIPPSSFPSTFATRLGLTIGGFPAFPSQLGISKFNGFFNGFGNEFGAFGGFGGGFGVPYPVAVGGDYGAYPAEQPNMAGYAPYAAQPSSPVTINQYFGPGGAPAAAPEAAPAESSGITRYQAPSPAAVAPAREEQPVFLIALKDTTVYPAIGYWLEGDALHYITPQGKHNQVSLGLVDRSISQRLNEGRKIDFHLPPG